MRTASPYMDPDQAKAPLVGLAEDYTSLCCQSHSHQRGQLYYCISGTLKVHAQSDIWLVSPHRAVWLPRGLAHRSYSKFPVSLRLLYFDQNEYPLLPDKICVLQISVLLRELIEAAIQQKQEWELHGPEARLADVIVDRLLLSPEEPLHLPLPTDMRVLAVCELIREDPQLHMDIGNLCKKIGVSQRTFTRILKKETKMNLQEWKQKLLLLSAIEMMANGVPITIIAMDLGYATPSAFTYMFRQILGVSPSEYLSTMPK